ncbi:hypothetical protein RUM43_004955 [Polyplax serrata]|uniref:Uncharacterized protein n=1 Tax=Polyplax serrata TaxID=468196 RepID=A0AAN8XMR5_POLSC
MGGLNRRPMRKCLAEKTCFSTENVSAGKPDFWKISCWKVSHNVEIPARFSVKQCGINAREKSNLEEENLMSGQRLGAGQEESQNIVFAIGELARKLSRGCKSFLRKRENGQTVAENLHEEEEEENNTREFN